MGDLLLCQRRLHLHGCSGGAAARRLPCSHAPTRGRSTAWWRTSRRASCASGRVATHARARLGRPRDVDRAAHRPHHRRGLPGGRLRPLAADGVAPTKGAERSTARACARCGLSRPPACAPEATVAAPSESCWSRHRLGSVGVGRPLRVPSRADGRSSLPPGLLHASARCPHAPNRAELPHRHTCLCRMGTGGADAAKVGELDCCPSRAAGTCKMVPRACASPLRSPRGRACDGVAAIPWIARVGSITESLRSTWPQVGMEPSGADERIVLGHSPRSRVGRSVRPWRT